MKNFTVILVIAIVVLFGGIFWGAKESLENYESEQKAFIYQKGNSFDLKQINAWVVYPRIAVVDNFIDNGNATSLCSFVIYDGSGKEKSVCLRVFDEKTGIAIFLAREEMRMTNWELIPVWAKDLATSVIERMIIEEVRIIEMMERLDEKKKFEKKQNYV